MAIIATSKGGQKALPSAGTHLARCYYVCDLGTQTTDWQGKPKKARKVRIGFELPNEQHIFDQARGKEPFTISKEYTLSLHTKAELRKVLESWRGRAFTDQELDKFDVAKLIGAPALISIAHEPRRDGEGNFAKLLTVSRPMKEMNCPPAIMPAWEYSIHMGRNEAFEALPDWLQEKVAKCDEWTKPSAGDDPTPAQAPEAEDDVPF
jgi:hypothetical protein